MNYNFKSCSKALALFECTKNTFNGYIYTLRSFIQAINDEKAVYKRIAHRAYMAKEYKQQQTFDPRIIVTKYWNEVKYRIDPRQDYNIGITHK